MFIQSLHHHLRRMRGISLQKELASSPQSTCGPKRYERMDVVPLPTVAPLDMSLAEALSRRHTEREFGGEVVALADISSLLFHSAHHNRPSRRPYPSGGGWYPVEIYVISFGIETCENSVLHYESDTHVLRRLWEVPQSMRDIHTIIDKQASTPSALIVLTSVWNRNEPTYKRFAYILALLEAGHLGQNLCLVAEALSLGICPLGGFNDEKIIELLDIDERYEQPVYVLALGLPLRLVR